MKNVLRIFLAFFAISLLVYFLAPGWILQTTLNLAVTSGGFRGETVEAGQITAHYFDNHRAEKPVMVLLHGFADRKESWFPFINKFSKDFRIIVPDALGHGDNVRDTAMSYSLESQADFIHDLTQELQTGTFHLVGISMGGGIAGKYADRYPEDLQSIIFISSAGMDDCEKMSALDVRMKQYETREEKAANFPLIPQSYSRANARLFKKYVFYGNFFIPNRLFKEYLMPVIEERDFYIRVLGDLVDIKSGRYHNPLDDELSKIQCPVLIIWGRDDPLLDASCASEMEKLLPNPPDVVMIDKCGHATIVEQARETHVAMRDFLKKVIR